MLHCSGPAPGAAGHGARVVTDSGSPHPPTVLDRIRLLSWPLVLMLGALLACAAALLVLSEISVRITTRNAEEISRNLQRLEASATLKALVVDAETGQRGFLLTQDPGYLEPFETAMETMGSEFDRLRRLTPSRELRARIDEMEAAAEERLSVASFTVSLVHTGQLAEAFDTVRSGRGKVLMDRFRQQLAEFDAVAERDLVRLRAQQDSAALWPRLAALVSTVLAIGLIAVVSRLMLRGAQAREAERLDVTETAQQLQRQVEARTAELSDLTSHLQSVTERDKAELARNLHDELGGLLTAARMDISWLQGATKDLDTEIAGKLLALNTALQEAMDVKRRVVESLRPALLDHFGLPTALQNYFDETCRKADINCTTTVPEEMAGLPQDLAIGLFRVGQESLTNIIRHARAKNVRMTMETVDEEIHVTVVDDGVGLDLSGRQFRRSHGISGMRHRIRGLGGTFDMQSQPGAGTTIRIVVPLVRPPAPVPFADAAP